MKSVLLALIVIYRQLVCGQAPTVRRASLLNLRGYVIDVVSLTVQEVEDLHFCNLKIPDISKQVSYQFFGQTVSGDVSFKNGYVVSVQHLDIVESTVQQVWTWNTNDELGMVDVRAQLRMHDVVLGFDVVAHLNGTTHRYTSTFTHRLLSFNFSILKNMKTRQITVTITGVDPRSTGLMSFTPNDKYSDLLGTSFTPAETVPGILAWGPEIIQPRAYNVVTTKIEFPTPCYNC